MTKYSSYNGGIEVISGFTQKNGGTFALVDAHDVQVDEDDTRLDAALTDITTKLVPDTSLSISGKSADAKVTGDAINNINDKIVPDTSLSISGKSADAKVTGDAISRINKKLESVDILDDGEGNVTVAYLSPNLNVSDNNSGDVVIAAMDS